MIYFIYGEDSYRVKKKLEEIVLSYKEKNKSGLNLIYIDAEEKGFNDFYSGLKTNSMFAEKKLIILKNIFSNLKFQENFLENIKNLESSKDVVVIYEDNAPDKRTKFFKTLQKTAKCQEFGYLQPAQLKIWAIAEFEKNKSKVEPDALDLFISYVGSDLWKMNNEINKLSNYKKNSIIDKKDIELLVRPNIDNDIFKTIEAVASKNKKLALSLLYKHFDNGDAALYLFSMITYQFRNLLIIKDLQSTQPYGAIAKKSGLHPFVVQKSFYLCNQFSIQELKKIYQKIFQVDADIKIGKIEAELALELLLSEI